MEKYGEFQNALADCINACEFCASACLKEDDVKKLADCIKLDRDCADICSLTFKFLSRNSSEIYSLVELCKDLCSQCAMECDNHDHSHCQRCAEACRACEEECDTFLKQYEEIDKLK